MSRTDLFLLPGAVGNDPQVDAWFAEGVEPLRQLAKQWFDCMRACGADVRELLHDGCPTACVDTAAFGYVNAFTAHVNVGFFHGADLPDPQRLLQGSGRRMRHVKLHWGEPFDERAVADLIAAAYRDIRVRLAAARDSPF